MRGTSREWRAWLSPQGTEGWRWAAMVVVPLLIVLAPVPFWYIWRRGYWLLVGEDRLAELLTAIMYAAAAVLALLVADRLRRSALLLEGCLFLLLSLGAVFIAGEEVSWGQRQLGFAGPTELVAHNKQGEANLHNLLGRYALHAVYIAVTAYAAALARWLVPKIPRLRDRAWLFVPPADLVVFFAVCLGYYVWFDYLDPVVVGLLGPRANVEILTGPKLQEVAELALAVGVLLFVARLAMRQNPGEPPRADRSGAA